MDNLKVTLIQPDIKWQDINYNLRHIEQQLSVADVSTDLIVLPEMFNTGFSMHPEVCFEEMGGVTMQWMQAMAEKYKCALVGSLIIRENNTFFNRMVWMFPNGQYETYDKHHLFRFGKENEHYSDGNKKVIVTYKGWKFNLNVCYDLRFPVWSRNSYKNGSYDYDVYVNSANWAVNRERVWRILLPARAIENQVYAIGVNRVGADADNAIYAGGSMVVDSYGKIILATQDNKEEIKTIELSYDDLQRKRESFGVAQDWDDFELK